MTSEEPSAREIYEALRDAMPTEIFALIPDRHGVSIVDVRALINYVDDDDMPLEEAIANAGIDSVMGDVGGYIERLRWLNQGDSDAYWNRES